jgi:nicotinate-nucleotide pyrophosphorylase (carboxylating)
MTLPEDLRDIVDLALQEDIGSGDITASLIDASCQAEATVICREQAIICGQPWFDACFQAFDSSVKVEWLVSEGVEVGPDTVLCRISGAARSLLTVERTALNFLQTLSAVATETQRYASAIQGSRTRVLDTRKTLPGLRSAEKYAVACGGGKNHRMGLYDALLIKENHIMAAGSITAAVKEGKKRYPDKPLEVETENLDEFQEALEAGADIIMLDNYSLEDIRKAVAMNKDRTKIEVSGNVTLDTISGLAATGVDYISVGALTKSIRAIDLSMRIQLDL